MAVVLPDLLCLWLAHRGGVGVGTVPGDPMEQLFASRIPELYVSGDIPDSEILGMADPLPESGIVCAPGLSACGEPLCPQGSCTAHCLS